MPAPGQRIAVCIITYRRPDGLRRALAAVAAQQLGDAPPDLRVIVVDNDGDGDGTTARVVDAAREAMAWPLDHVIEPRRGIPFARNRCVAVARPVADWIAFIDDDEEPAPTWLAELVRVQQAYDADVVTGPVLPRFVGEVPPWVVKGRLFDRLRYPTGTRRDRAFTGNVMLRARLFDEVRPHFDERMALSGGSDTHFSQRLYRAGYRIVWADEAEVVETVPASRVSAGWIYRRAYRIGATNGFIARDLRALPVAAGMILPFSVYRVLKGGLLAALGGFAGRHWVVAGIRQICYGAGMVVGLFGGRYDEYSRNHGS